MSTETSLTIIAVSLVVIAGAIMSLVIKSYDLGSVVRKFVGPRFLAVHKLFSSSRLPFREHLDACLTIGKVGSSLGVIYLVILFDWPELKEVALNPVVSVFCFFITIFSGVPVLKMVDCKIPSGLKKTVLYAALSMTVYMLLYGLFLLPEWQSKLFINTPDPGAVRVGGSGAAVVLFAVIFWPVILIGFGYFMSFIYSMLLRDIR